MQIAVFMPTEIQEPDANNYLVSTGAFERALEEGYKIYVVSTRDELTMNDRWWRDQVDPNNIILCRPLKEGEIDSGLRLNEPWKALYELLGYDYPHGFYAGVDSGEVPWTAARYNLTQLKIRLGSSFRVRRIYSARPGTTSTPARPRLGERRAQQPRRNPRERSWHP